jgi:hypothetical protein
MPEVIERKGIPWWALLLIGLAISILVMMILQTCNRDSGIGGWVKRDTTILDTNYEYHTITTYDHVVDNNVTEFNRPIIPDPKVIIIHVKDTIREKDTFTVMRDSVVLVRIPSNFLRNFPNNPKIIQGAFTKDSMRLDLYYPWDHVSSISYPTDYEKYRYIWENDSLKAIKIKHPFFKQIKSEVYMYSLYDPFFQDVRLELDGTLSYKSVGLYGRLGLGLKPFQGRALIGTKVKIK